MHRPWDILAASVLAVPAGHCRCSGRFGLRQDPVAATMAGMKPDERIRAITECAESLVARPWSEIQLTLDQFGFETYEASHDWDFDERTYCIDQIKNRPDDVLLRLHGYLLGHDAAPGNIADQPWGALPLKVFLSHIHQHRIYAGGVKRWLTEAGIDSFVAHDDILPSKQWREVIKAALRSCDALVAFLHDGFHESQWCDQEVGWAIGRGVPVIVLRPHGSERRDGFLEEHQDMPLVQEATVAATILKILVNDPRTSIAGVRSLAEAFVNSYSYDRTRDLCALLDQQSVIEPEQLRRLEYAVQTNRQVYEGMYPALGPSRPVPDFISELVARHTPPPVESPSFDTDAPF